MALKNLFFSCWYRRDTQDTSAWFAVKRFESSSEAEWYNQEFPTRVKYQYHVKCSQVPNVVSCPQCNAEFPSQLKMLEHINRQNEKLYECQVPRCKHRTVIKLRLAKHYIKSKLHKNLLPEERVKFIALLNINQKTCKVIDKYYLTGIGEPPRAKL